MAPFPTFFGIEIHPNHTYKANINHELILTRATINEQATGDQNSRLFINIEKSEGPVCHLDCELTTVPLSIHVSRGVQLVIRVAGDCSIYVTGYAAPDEKPHTDDTYGKNPISSDEYYYEEDEEEEEKSDGNAEEDKKENEEKTEEKQ